MTGADRRVLRVRACVLTSPSSPEPQHLHLTMDNSPTALFDSYEQDFQQIIASIREKLEGDGKDERGGALCVTEHGREG